MAAPSLFARRICEGKAAKRLSHMLLGRVFRDGVGLELRSDSSHIAPFEFNTPSPDDDVQSKQKGAFERDRKGQLHKVHKPGMSDRRAVGPLYFPTSLAPSPLLIPKHMARLDKCLGVHTR